MVLSIPATIRKIKEEGREEGRREVVQAIEKELSEGRDIQEVLRFLSNGKHNKP